MKANALFCSAVGCCVAFAAIGAANGQDVLVGRQARQDAELIFSADAGDAGKMLWNPCSVGVVWDAESLLNPGAVLPTNGVATLQFIEEMELMQCTGGSPTRDRFKDSLNAAVRDDYDFSRLVAACRVLVSRGVRPYLKLGNVPCKLSARRDDKVTFFNINIRPPADYGEWYRYTAAMARALVEAFGRDRVRTWRFAVLTECDNSLWFKDDTDDPARTRDAFFALYDHAVAALEDEIAPDVRVGVHPGGHGRGWWNACDIFDHCARGTNFHTGKTGTRLDFVAVSFYDHAPGVNHRGFSWHDTFARLRDAAAECGFGNLEWGVDEGRVFQGRTAGAKSRDLPMRAAGLSWQGAWDARAIRRQFDDDVRYFAAWGYLGGPNALFEGLPSPSYFVAQNAAGFAGMRRTPVSRHVQSDGCETDMVAAWDEKGRRFLGMAYRFSYDLKSANPVNVRMRFGADAYRLSDVRVVLTRIGDEVNWFPLWERDRKRLGIDDKDFGWSPDDLAPLAKHGLARDEHRRIFREQLEPVYRERARLRPECRTVRGDENGYVEIKTFLHPHEVVFVCLSLNR